MKILITGFDPFGGEPVNASWDAVRTLPDAVDGVELVKLQLPTSFRRSVVALRAAIAHHEPDVIVNVGQAGGTAELRVERVAVNVDDAAIADNDGDRPSDRAIRPDAPDAYFSTLPIKAMAAAMRATGVAAVVSNSAGTFVCNHVFYEACAFVATERPDVRAGFVHVPSRAGREHALSIEAIAQALLAGVHAIRDAAVNAGASARAGSGTPAASA